jgi:hypothetical protein
MVPPESEGDFEGLTDPPGVSNEDAAVETGRVGLPFRQGTLIPFWDVLLEVREGSV